MLIPLFAQLPISADALSSDDVTNCGGSSIANHIQAGVNYATDSNGCDNGGGVDVQAEIGMLASKVVNIFSIVVGVIAVIMVIYGGFRYIISGGDSGKVGNAKNTLIYAIVGLIIVALAQLIVHYVLNTANDVSSNSIGLMILRTHPLL
jgi:uncharacterized membrane protein